jgi:hypothetical protein
VFGLAFLETFENFMTGLAMWAAFGGMVVIIGGLILTSRWVRFGRILVSAGIIVGVIGLLMTLVQMASAGVFVMGMIHQLQQSLGWVGAMMAFIARIIAEQKPMVDR